MRIPPIEVSIRWPVGGPRMNKLSKNSPSAGKRNTRLSRICDTYEDASGELLQRQVQQLLKGVTQPGPSCCWQLKIFPKVLPGSEDLGTQPQLHQPRRSQSPPNI